MTIHIISDTHFSHQNSLVFKNEVTGEKMRHWEPDQVEQMNEHMVQQWNSVVSPTDVAIHLGDVFFTKDGWKILERLNGKKKLILGNHDEPNKLKNMLPFFDEIHGVHDDSIQESN